MKQIRIFLPVLLFCLALFIGCKKDEDIPKTNGAFTTSKTTVTVDEEITFTNTSVNATSYTWSFGDGTTSVEASPKKSWAVSGVYNVTLSATGAGGNTISNATITVTPLTAFTVENESGLSSGSPVQFTNNSKGAASYEWSFGDVANRKSTDANPTFTYAAGGTYTVTLKSTGAGGSTMATKDITVTTIASNKELYFIELSAATINKVLLKSGETPSVVADITAKGGVGIAYDAVNSKIYFSDFEVTGEGKIWRMNLDGSGMEAIVTGLTDPYSIALNVAGGKIYWADDLGNISSANLDGTGVVTSLINIPDGQMRGLDFDNKNNKLYFYEVNGENLYVANADGTNVSVLIAGIYGYSIFVDEVNDKLYYDDRTNAALQRSNLDGTGSTVIVAAPSTRIFGIAIDDSTNKLYWADRDAGEMKRANLDGTSPETILSSLQSPRGIFIK